MKQALGDLHSQLLFGASAELPQKLDVMLELGLCDCLAASSACRTSLKNSRDLSTEALSPAILTEAPS